MDSEIEFVVPGVTFTHFSFIVFIHFEIHIQKCACKPVAFFSWAQPAMTMTQQESFALRFSYSEDSSHLHLIITRTRTKTKSLTITLSSYHSTFLLLLWHLQTWAVCLDLVWPLAMIEQLEITVHNGSGRTSKAVPRGKIVKRLSKCTK